MLITWLFFIELAKHIPHQNMYSDTKYLKMPSHISAEMEPTERMVKELKSLLANSWDSRQAPAGCLHQKQMLSEVNGVTESMGVIIGDIRGRTILQS